MKKTLIALAALSAIAGAAQAQSSVTLYGRLDASVGQLTTETTSSVPASVKAKITQTVVGSSEVNTTFWGLKGSEDLGGGMYANFVLESAFNMDNGATATGNTLFEREANVGLSGSFGAVKLGRQNSAYYALFGATNNVYESNFQTTTTAWNTGVLVHNTRVTNSIGYASPVFSGFSGAVVYGLGENKTATTDAESSFSLHAKYANGPLLVGYAHLKEKQIIGSAFLTPTTTVSTTAETRKYNLIAGSYDLGVAKLTGGYNVAKSDTLKDKEFQLGVSVPFGAAALAAGYSRSKSESTTATIANNDGKGFSLLGTYNLSKRTTVYAGYENTEVESKNATETAKRVNYAAGVRHTF